MEGVREARGTDVRSLWAGLCRIGRVLGKKQMIKPPQEKLTLDF